MIELDHFIVSARDRQAAARLLAQLLDVPWDAEQFGVFSPVYISRGLTLDFIQADAPFPVEHVCFRVNDAEFDAILAHRSGRHRLAQQRTRAGRPPG